MLTSANQVREEFRRSFAFPIVLWVNDEIYQQFSQLAPDLESWATTNIFTISSDELTDFIQQTADELLANSFNITLELCTEIKSAWQELQNAADFFTLNTQANCQFLRGLVAYIDQDLDAAITYYQQSLAFWQTSNNLERQGQILSQITICYYAKARANELVRAGGLRLYRRASALGGSADLKQLACDFQSPGLLQEPANLHQQIQNYLDQSINAFESAQRPDLIANSLEQFGIILRYLNNWQQLKNLAERALQVHQAENNKIKIAQDYNFLAAVALAQANWQPAQELAKTALDILANYSDVTTTNDDALRQELLFNIAQAQQHLKQYQTAISNLAAARAIGITNNDPEIYLKILDDLRELFLQQKQYLPAFDTKLEIRSIEQQFGLRAFLGAGRLEAAKQAGTPNITPLKLENKDSIAPEIAASGRQLDIEQLIERIGRPDYKLIVIHGQSGVGKSSLVNAGLVPALKNKAIGYRDNLPVVMRGYSNWVRELGRLMGEGRSLSEVEVTEERESGEVVVAFEDVSPVLDTHSPDVINDDSIYSGSYLPVIQSEPHPAFANANAPLPACGEGLGVGLKSTSSNREPLYSVVKSRLIASLQENEQNNLRTVLIFDQFEEFFFDTEPKERRQFFEFLGECLNVLSAKVILSLRVDYLHYLLECNDLSSMKIIANDILSRNVLYKLGNFSRENTKSIIERLTQNTSFRLETALIDQLVQDLAEELGEVRPIELQVVGAQLQTENIRTLAEYRQRATKQQLVQRYLDEVVNDCGGENKQMAEVLLYLLTDEKGTRPLKTRAELERDLQQFISVAGEIPSTPLLMKSPQAGGSPELVLTTNQLDLVLEIFVKSGLVMLLPETPADRYQLVHDYLAAFIRQQQEPKLKEIMAELEKERQQRKLSEAKLNSFLKHALFGSVAAGIVLAGLAVTAWNAAQQADKQRKQAEISEINALNNSSEALLVSAQHPDALIEAFKAVTKLKQAPWAKADTQMRTVATLNQGVYLQAGENPANRAVEGRTLEGHNSWVISVSFSRDGQTLASGSDDNTIKLWDVSTGKLLKTLSGHNDSVWSVSFSPDGKTLASGSRDKTIKLWDVSTGKLLKTLSGHSNWVNSVSFSPDGQTLASGSSDKTIKLWDVSTGKLLKTLSGHSNWVNSVSFSPDGKTLASGSLDNTIKLWDVSTGKPLKTLSGHSDWVNSVSFSPDGQTLASGSLDNTIKLWDVSTGKPLKTLSDHGSGVWSVSFSPDGKTLASGSSDNTIKLWDVSTDKPLTTLSDHGSGVYSVSFSPDGKTLASGSADNTIKLWDVSTGKPLTTLSGHNDLVYSVSFSPDGQTLASGSFDNTIKLWDVSTDKPLTTLSGHGSRVLSVSFSPYCQTLASGSSDKTIKLWDVSTGTLLKTLSGHNDSVYSVSFSSDGQTLASGSSDNTIKLWDVSTGKLLKTLSDHGSGVYSVSFSPDGKTLASGSADNTIKLWDVSTGKPLKTLSGHNDSVYSVSFSSDGQTLASGSSDKTIKLWDVSTGKLLKTLSGHSSYVYSVSFSPDGKTLASGSEDKTIKLWDVSTGTLLKTLSAHSSRIWSVSFSPDGQTLASGSADNTIKLWDLNLSSLLDSGCTLLNNYLIAHPETLEEVKECQTPSRLMSAATVLVTQGEKLAQNDDINAAVAKFNKAQQWDKQLNFDPQAKATEFAIKGKAQRKLQEGQQLVKDGKVSEAVTAYTDAQKLDPKIEISADAWNTLCRQGSIRKQAQLVLFACEKAVTLAPNDGEIRDSRGLARALTGDTPGAIADFEAYIAWTNDKDRKAQRQRWVKELKAGQNPFTEAELKVLLNQ
ncbi:ribosome assembly protein 4 [Nostoc sp. FACHB-110]|nr:ribosome assembly protein 4 [Nostoc sp. FACHB-110]